MWTNFGVIATQFPMFVFRDLQLRYRQTLIGILSGGLQPLAQVVVFTSFFHLLGNGRLCR